MNEIVLPGQKGLDQPEKMLNDILAWAEVGEKDPPEVLRLMADLSGTNPHDLAALDDVPLKDWLARYKIPMGVYTFLATIRC